MAGSDDIPPPPGWTEVETPPEPDAPTAPPRRVRYSVAIGGGRGGVGKTLLSANLAVYLAQLGRNVVICDADPYGSNLHSALGISKPPLARPDDIAEGRAKPVSTIVPGLSVLPTAYDPGTLAPRRPTRKTHWRVPLGQLDVDYVVVHLGASTAPAALDAFFEADIHVCVTAPEPTAIEATYRFCRALYARRLKRALMREKFKLRVLERALDALPPLPTPRDVVAEIARFDEAVANVAAATMSRVRPGLVVGKTRLRRDLDLGPAMSALSARYLGIAMDYLGYVEHDDAVWLTARRRRPLLTDAPTAKSARNIERVARRLLAVMAARHQERPAREPEPPGGLLGQLGAPMTLYDVLGVPRTAGDEEIRRAYKLQREIFREDSLPIVSLVDGPGVREEQARIKEAYDTLLDPVRKGAYDMSVFPDDEPASVAPEHPQPSATEAELAELRAELAREMTPETPFTGALLRRAREAQGIELGEVAQKTKIAPMHLRAIEAEDFAALPARVYVAGFLKEMAKVLGLDPTQVTKTYLKRLRAARAGRDG